MIATIAEIEAEIVDRTGGLLIVAEISQTPKTDASPRAYLASPIGYAIRKSGGSTAGVRNPTTSDLLTVDLAKLDQLYDLAELRTIDNALGNWTQPDQTEGPLSQKLGALATFFHDRAEALREKIKDVYKVDADTPQVATDGLGGFSGGGAANTGSLAYF